MTILDSIYHEHSRLLADKERDNAFWKRVKDFVDTGARAGARLWAPEHRQNVQSILDYWACILVAEGHGFIDAAIQDFNMLAPGGLLPLQIVKVNGLQVELWTDGVKVRVGGEALAIRRDAIPALISALREVM